jgi:hypothetical protein
MMNQFTPKQIYSFLATIVLFCSLILLSSCEVGTPTQTVTSTFTKITDIVPVSTLPISKNSILQNAVHNLIKTSSFETSSHEIRAYKATSPDKSVKIVYGEFIRKCEVIQSPEIKANCSQTYRYSPESDFFSDTTYYWQANGNYYQKEFLQDLPAQETKTDFELIEPFSNDVYKTLINYYKNANFVNQEGNIAKFVLVHPEWFKLNSALGFTNLGLFLTMKDKDKLIKEYLVDHYQNVTPPIFTIFIDTNTEQIKSVEINDKDFMTSVWADIDQEIKKQNGENLVLTQYEVLDSNSSVHYFQNYDQVADFQIP